MCASPIRNCSLGMRKVPYKKSRGSIQCMFCARNYAGWNLPFLYLGCRLGGRNCVKCLSKTTNVGTERSQQRNGFCFTLKPLDIDPDCRIHPLLHSLGMSKRSTLQSSVRSSVAAVPTQRFQDCDTQHVFFQRSSMLRRFVVK